MTARPESPYRRFFTRDRSFAQLVRRKDRAVPDGEQGAEEQKPPQGAKQDPDSERQE
nr:hypothetical protein [Anaerofilum sp. An201]